MNVGCFGRGGLRFERVSGSDARPGCLLGAGQRGVSVGCVQRLVNLGRSDAVGDEAVVPVRYEGCGWSWGRGGCGRALVSPPSLSPLTPAWFPTNIACDFQINLANAEVGSLESQRLWRLMKTGRGKLRATFLGECRMCRPILSLVPSR